MLFKKRTLQSYIVNQLGRDHVEIVRKFIPAEDNLCGITIKDITLCSYQEIKHILPELMDANKYEEVIYTILKTKKKNITFAKIYRSNIRKRMLFIFWIQEQYKLINRLEDEMLISSPSSEQINAGIHTLNVLGDVNIIDSLSNGNVLKWAEIRNMPYGRIFEKQLRGVLMDRIAEKMENNRKNKRK